jgi:transcriptional repressor NrdR
MRCPFCHHDTTAVKDSRTTEDQTSIRRRRFCEACGSRFTTFERVQLRGLSVVKKDGSRVPFERDKLSLSIQTALRKRPFTSEHVEKIVNGIIRNLETSGEETITTEGLGEMVLHALLNVDVVGYVRFASVYRDFSGVDDFISLISSIDACNQ